MCGLIGSAGGFFGLCALGLELRLELRIGLQGGGFLVCAGGARTVANRMLTLPSPKRWHYRAPGTSPPALATRHERPHT
jgi:hypothetical protein